MKNTIGLNSKNSLRLLAGRYESQNQNVTNLKMYNFMVYNRVLNETEIKKNFDVDVQKFDITEYVEEGMVLHYDGVNNTGKGHSNTASTWKDLSGKGNDGNFSKTPNTSNFYWKENCIVLSNNKKNVYVDTPLSLNNSERTIIYTVDASNLSGTIWGDTDDNNSNGLFNYSTFLANRGAGTDIQNRYDYNFKREGIYNYAVSLSSSELKFYENGKLKTTIKNTIGLKTNNNMRLLAARYTGSNQSSSNIKMYNFLIYNRVLSDAEIEKTYYIDKEKYGF